jgi:hypothetical protein
LDGLADEVIDRGQESGERLAGPGRRGNQSMPARLDSGPRFGLRLSRLGELPGKPGSYGWMKINQGHSQILYNASFMDGMWKSALGKPWDDRGATTPKQ